MDAQEKKITHDETLYKSSGLRYTAKEIANQPALWKETYKLFVEQKEKIRDFLAKAYHHDDLVVILTGAGSSAFVGETMEGHFASNINKNVKAVATTNIVSHPAYYLPVGKPVLLISFARSGNSPESVATVKLADQVCSKVYHLVVTCNPEGKLANINTENLCTFLLPSKANDKGLAMTGSFSAMALVAYLLASIADVENLYDQVNMLSDYGERILNNHSKAIFEAASKNFNRIVFLGSGPALGIAHEAHLKVQELTDGKVLGKYDSFLAFRHGPKAVVDQQTLIVYLFSCDPYAFQYEVDLVNAIYEENKYLHTIGVLQHKISLNVDTVIGMSEDSCNLDDSLTSIASVLTAQLIGLYKSMELGLNPDNPSVDGTINRVVQGVKIYQY